MRYHKERFADFYIVRPSPAAELKNRRTLSKHIADNFDQGTLSKREDISAFLRSCFDFYKARFDKHVETLAARDFISLVFSEYDQSCRIHFAWKAGRLSADEGKRWQEVGPFYRRGLKYLAEMVTLAEPGEIAQVEKTQVVTVVEELLVAAEELARLYLLSDYAYYLPEQAPQVELLTGEHPWTFSFAKRYDLEFQRRVNRDHRYRSKETSMEPDYLLNVERMNETLSAPMRKALGFDLLQVIDLFQTLIEDSEVASSFDVPFLSIGEIRRNGSEVFDVSPEAISVMLDGFTVMSKNMETEEREIMRANQRHRAWHRGFFEFPHPKGRHITFSRQMAVECGRMLLRGIHFQKFPPEWSMGNEEVRIAADKLANQSSKWFEDRTFDTLRKLGIVGVASLEVIAFGNTRIRIPSEVGEIDFVGYSKHDDLLLVADAKMVLPRSEPRGYRDDRTAFTEGTKSYEAKLSKKVEWVRANIDLICHHLQHKTDFDRPLNVERIRVAGVLVTCFPTYARFFTKQFPCTSLTNLVLDYEAYGKWPYPQP